MGAAALDGGHIGFFGEMMNNTHESCRRYFENSAPEVDLLVDTAQGVSGVYGAKLSGGGWGGAAVIVHTPESEGALHDALTAAYRKTYSRDPILLPTWAAAGADAVRFS